MYRAQGIKKRWELERLKDTEQSRVSPLTYLIDLEYNNYLKLCFWCFEKPIKKGAWLRQEIQIN